MLIILSPVISQKQNEYMYIYIYKKHIYIKKQSTNFFIYISDQLLKFKWSMTRFFIVKTKKKKKIENVQNGLWRNRLQLSNERNSFKNIEMQARYLSPTGLTLTNGCFHMTEEAFLQYEDFRQQSVSMFLNTLSNHYIL